MFNIGTPINARFFIAKVVDKQDPAMAMRVKIRIVGYHPFSDYDTEDDHARFNIVEDEDLPWAPCVDGTYGGVASLPNELEWVFGCFIDGDDAQIPIVLGMIPGTNLNDMEAPTFNRTAGGTNTSDTGRDEDPAPADPNYVAPGYPDDMTDAEIVAVIREEAELRGMDPDVAVRIYQHEGRGSYQSTVPRSGSGSLGGREASFGPYQLFTGGGAGNDYERRTGRTLTQDNTRDGITNQIRFSLDHAITNGNGWQPWYGRRPAGVGRFDGLGNARPANNWE